MSCKTVFCVIGRDECNQDLIAAINLCIDAEAHLNVFIVGVAPVPIGGYGVLSSNEWMLEREAELASIKTRQEKVRSLINAYGLSADIDTEYSHKDWLDDMIGRRARYSDLIVIGPDLMLQPQLREPAIEGALFHSSRPTLVVPSGSKATIHPKKIVLAWDGGIEAVRATHEAIDMLVGADDVHLSTVGHMSSGHENRIGQGGGLAAYLKRRGVNLTIDQLPAGRKTIAEILNEHAATLGADMLVMGAYGHSRLHERVFGGVTRSMLAAPTLPLFMTR